MKIAFHLNVTERFSLKTNNTTIMHFAKKSFTDFQRNNLSNNEYKGTHSYYRQYILITNNIDFIDNNANKNKHGIGIFFLS